MVLSRWPPQFVIEPYARTYSGAPILQCMLYPDFLSVIQARPLSTLGPCTLSFRTPQAHPHPTTRKRNIQRHPLNVNSDLRENCTMFDTLALMALLTTFYRVYRKRKKPIDRAI